MDSIIYKRIQELCDEQGITIGRLEAELGMSNSSIKKWRTSASPTVDKLAKVAKYFNVSLDYLTGASDIRSTVEDTLQDEEVVTFQRIREKFDEQGNAIVSATVQSWFDLAFGTNPDKGNGSV